MCHLLSITNEGHVTHVGLLSNSALFLGIWNWGGIDKCLGGVNMREAQIYIKKH